MGYGVGPPMPRNGTCSYGPRPEKPNIIPCTKAATVHLLTDIPDPTYDPNAVMTLSSCDEHVVIARKCANIIQEHRHEAICDMPSTMWNRDLNKCVIDFGGTEPTVVVSIPEPVSV